MTLQVASVVVVEWRSRVYDVTVVIGPIFGATFPFHSDGCLVSKTAFFFPTVGFVIKLHVSKIQSQI